MPVRDVHRSLALFALAATSTAIAGGGPVLVDLFTGGADPELWGVRSLGATVVSVVAEDDRLELPSAMNPGSFGGSALVGTGFRVSLLDDFEIRVDWRADLLPPLPAGDTGMEFIIAPELAPGDDGLVDAVAVSIGSDDRGAYEGFEITLGGVLVDDGFSFRSASSGTIVATYATASDVLTLTGSGIGTYVIPGVRAASEDDDAQVVLAGFSDGVVPPILGDARWFDAFEVVSGTVVTGLNCPGDVDGSGSIGFPDLVSVLSAFGPCDGCPEDFDASGAVGFEDLLTVLGAWGACD